MMFKFCENQAKMVVALSTHLLYSYKALTLEFLSCDLRMESENRHIRTFASDFIVPNTCGIFIKCKYLLWIRRKINIAFIYIILLLFYTMLVPLFIHITIPWVDEVLKYHYCWYFKALITKSGTSTTPSDTGKAELVCLFHKVNKRKSYLLQALIRKS